MLVGAGDLANGLDHHVVVTLIVDVLLVRATVIKRVALERVLSGVGLLPLLGHKRSDLAALAARVHTNFLTDEGDADLATAFVTGILDGRVARVTALLQEVLVVKTVTVVKLAKDLASGFDAAQVKVEATLFQVEAEVTLATLFLDGRELRHGHGSRRDVLHDRVAHLMVNGVSSGNDLRDEGGIPGQQTTEIVRGLQTKRGGSGSGKDLDQLDQIAKYPHGGLTSLRDQERRG